MLQITLDADDWDMPAESGNFAGGFVGSATQAARYARLREKTKEK